MASVGDVRLSVTEDSEHPFTWLARATYTARFSDAEVNGGLQFRDTFLLCDDDEDDIDVLASVRGAVFTPTSRTLERRLSVRVHQETLRRRGDEDDLELFARVRLQNVSFNTPAVSGDNRARQFNLSLP